MTKHPKLTPRCSSAQNSPSATEHQATSLEQQTLSATRASAYVNDLTSSYVQHRHSSAQEAISHHTTAMRTYLDDFDAQMAQALDRSIKQ